MEKRMSNHGNAYKFMLEHTVTQGPNIYHITVDSMVLEAVRWIRESQRLYVYLHSGRTYCYWPVDYDVFVQFVKADSMGSFYNHFIKPVYQAERCW